MSDETNEQIEARRQQAIKAGQICLSHFCSYPQADGRGWCVNCGNAQTEQTRESWKDVPNWQKSEGNPY